MKRALVLLSGGLDSSLCLSMALRKPYEKVFCLIYDYGQKHKRELENAIKIAEHYKVDYKIINITSDLIMNTSSNPYIPFRNTIMLSMALGYAQTYQYNIIYYGANEADYSGFPDCRGNYIELMNKITRLHTSNIEIIAPLLYQKKEDIIKLAIRFSIPLHLTYSCYKGMKESCGKCPACEKRLEGFEKAGIKDPIQYVR